MLLSPAPSLHVCILITLSVVRTIHAGNRKPPNIIIFLADDMGINDVSFRGLEQYGTYNIDALAFNGIVLNNFYTSSTCTPSRSALLSSRFPIYIGMQRSVILESEPRGLPLNLKLLPEYLKDIGYKTALCGKWHLGFYHKQFTPTFRGFDLHHGYWQGYQDYYTHFVRETFGQMEGYDMRSNMDVDWNAYGIYSTHYFTEKAIDVIKSTDKDTPLFLMVSHLAPHSGHPDGRLKAPEETLRKFEYIADEDRKKFAAIVSELDKSVGAVMEALHYKGMLDNSVVLFLSDNGAPTEGVHHNSGSNYPLRGIKNTEFEGGVRNNAVIWSPLLKSQQRISNQLISLVDIMPTLCSAAGIDVSKLGDIDGINMWETLSNGVEEDVRFEMPYSIDIQNDSASEYGAIRVHKWKYIRGSPTSDVSDKWIGDSGRSQGYRYIPEQVLNSKVNRIINEVYFYQQFNEVDDLEEQSVAEPRTPLTIDKIQSLRQELTIKCPNLEGLDECKPRLSPCLVDVKLDPCERYNFAKKYPAVMKNMENKYREYRSKVVPPSNKPSGDSRSNPVLHNNTWVNWYDYSDEVLAGWFSTHTKPKIIRHVWAFIQNMLQHRNTIEIN